MAGYFSNAKLLVIPQAGHIALCDQPTEATDEGRRTVFFATETFSKGVECENCARKIGGSYIYIYCIYTYFFFGGHSM